LGIFIIWELTMISFLRTAAAAAVLATLVPVASADVLTFDDLTNGPTFFTSDYNGFKFGTNNIADTAWFATDEISGFYPFKSASTVVSTDFGLYEPGNLHEATQGITSAADFTFQGAWFGGFSTITYKLYNNGNLVHTSAESGPLSDTSAFVPSGYAGLIDEVVIVGEQGYYVMDDFTYNTPPVPEPGTVALMLVGLAAVGSVVRRRKA
jgi:hypothetical protein